MPVLMCALCVCCRLFVAPFRKSDALCILFLCHTIRVSGPPVEVGVTMYVLSISSLSEVKMDFTLDFYFRQFWTDPRLAYRKRPGVETLSVGSEFIKNIWVPDTFFVNEKQSYFHIATTSNEFIRVHHSGSITRSIR
uniref:Putative gamma-aminobutyric acid receptor subunit beta n=1 Tax=Anopheles darlingi TaxID=43151 RepID=A0A2M4D659_ANODA